MAKPNIEKPLGRAALWRFSPEFVSYDLLTSGITVTKVMCSALAEHAGMILANS